jgi:uncharacterized protein YndB with AHSA1/START domain
VVVTATPEQVWAAWTTREGITSLFAPDAEIDARVAGAFHIHIDPLAAPGSRGADDMRYMALQRPRMLSFDWNAPPSLPLAREPVSATETRVSLHHTGWGDGGEWDKTYQYFDKAWGVVLGNLQTRFKQGPKDWSDWLAQLRQWHEGEKKAETKKAAGQQCGGLVGVRLTVLSRPSIGARW